MRHCLQELLCTFHADMHLVYQPLVKGKNILRGITNLRLAAEIRIIYVSIGHV